MSKLILPKPGQIWQRKNDFYIPYRFYAKIYDSHTISGLEPTLEEAVNNSRQLHIKESVLNKQGDFMMIVKTFSPGGTSNEDKVRFIHAKLLIGERVAFLTYYSRRSWNVLFKRVA